MNLAILEELTHAVDILGQTVGHQDESLVFPLKYLRVLGEVRSKPLKGQFNQPHRINLELRDGVHIPFGVV